MTTIQTHQYNRLQHHKNQPAYQHREVIFRDLCPYLETGLEKFAKSNFFVDLSDHQPVHHKCRHVPIFTPLLALPPVAFSTVTLSNKKFKGFFLSLAYTAPS